ncbi:MAG TPA: hypothetical protein VLY87_03540 [Flavobacterium sp.]|nr:hypothetical protein [Flavobacterium sp.]
MSKFLKFIAGTAAALTVSFIFGCLLFQLFTKMNPLENWMIFLDKGTASKCFSIGSIPNIGLFYLFLNKNNYFSARGVIFSFILIALYIILG